MGVIKCTRKLLSELKMGALGYRSSREALHKTLNQIETQ